MKKTIIVVVSLILVATACQKELSYNITDTIGVEKAVAVNDTVYFLNSFYGGTAIYSLPTMWGSTDGGVFHCPDGCKLAYVSFRVNYQKGAVTDSLRVYTGYEFAISYDHGSPPLQARVKYIGNRAPGASIAFEYKTPKLLKSEVFFWGDSTRHVVMTDIKFHGPDFGWIRVMPDSISILSPLGKPLPVKGFNHSDWPDSPPSTKLIMLQ